MQSKEQNYKIAQMKEIANNNENISKFLKTVFQYNKMSQKDEKKYNVIKIMKHVMLSHYY